MTPRSSIGGSSSLMNMEMDWKCDRATPKLLTVMNTQYRHLERFAAIFSRFCSGKMQQNLVGKSHRFKKCFQGQKTPCMCKHAAMTGINRAWGSQGCHCHMGKKTLLHLLSLVHSFCGRRTAKTLRYVFMLGSGTLLVSLPVTYMHCGGLHVYDWLDDTVHHISLSLWTNVLFVLSFLGGVCRCNTVADAVIVKWHWW